MADGFTHCICILLHGHCVEGIDSWAHTHNARSYRKQLALSQRGDKIFSIRLQLICMYGCLGDGDENQQRLRLALGLSDGKATDQSRRF